jgi:uncharacterized protein (DUF1778 family)
MATTKPRITVTLTKHQHDVISTIAKLGGGSMSAFIGEMLEAALPTLERMAVTFQKVKQAQDQERGKFLESMDRAQAALEPVVMEAVGQFDLFLGKMEAAVADAPGDAGGAPVAADTAASAPTTNRGATPRRAKTAKPTAAKVSGVSRSSKKSKTPRMPTA